MTSRPFSNRLATRAVRQGVQVAVLAVAATAVVAAALSGRLAVGIATVAVTLLSLLAIKFVLIALAALANMTAAGVGTDRRLLAIEQSVISLREHIDAGLQEMASRVGEARSDDWQQLSNDLVSKVDTIRDEVARATERSESHEPALAELAALRSEVAYLRDLVVRIQTGH